VERPAQLRKARLVTSTLMTFGILASSVRLRERYPPLRQYVI